MSQTGRNDPQSLDNQLCFAVYAAAHAFGRAYRSLLAHHELTYPQYLVLLVLWELCARVEIIDPRFFPPPTRIVAAGGEMLMSGELWQHTAPTLMRLAVGGGIGTPARGKPA